jgi:hypothetical protein
MKNELVIVTIAVLAFGLIAIAGIGKLTPVLAIPSDCGPA